MHLTRFGFNVIVAIYLAPLVLIDFIGNTFSTGDSSDYYYYKAIFDGILLVYAFWQLFRGETAHVENAQTRKSTASDEVIGFENIGAIEYIYCALLSLYAAANWFFLHLINKQATGIASMGSLIWSLLSVAVCVLAAMQFWHLKSGTIVALKKKVIQ